MRQVVRRAADRAVRFRAMLAALILVAGVCGVSAVMLAANAATAAPAVTPGACGRVLLAGSGWLGGQGVDVKSNGPDQGTGNSCGGTNVVDGVKTGLEWQCVELVNRLYVSRGWIHARWPGNGGRSSSGARDSLYDEAPTSLAKQPNGSISYVGPGDVVSINVYDKGAFQADGHVLIVNAAGRVTSGSVPLVSQNGGDSGDAIVTSAAKLSNGTLTIPASGAWSYQVIGVVHAPVSSPKLASVSSLQTPDGYIHVFSGNSTGSVWETWFGNGHSPVSDLLGTPTGSPITAISSMYTSDGYLHVFAGTRSGDLYEFYFGNGNAPKWDKLGDPDGAAITSVSSLRTSDGYIHVFSSTANGYVWETWFGNGKSPVTDRLADLSGSEVDAITSMQTPDGYIHVFSGNATGSVWETWFGNGHSPVSDLLGTPDGAAVTSVSSLRTSDGYIHVFSSTANGYVWETWFGNGKSPVTDRLADLSG